MKKLLTITILVTMAVSVACSQTCDTLFNLTSPLDTPYYYYAAGSGVSSGYLSGNNEYGDLAKAEAFPAIIGDSIYSAVFYFQLATINPGDSGNAVTFVVWDNTGTSAASIPGAPGNIIDTATATLKQIAQSVTNSPVSEEWVGYIFYGLQVNFAKPVALTTDTIYVGVILPTTLGDTIVLLTNEVPPGPDGNGWELVSNSTWGSYNDDWGITGGSLGNYISAEICGSATTGINMVSNAVKMQVFPNPANSQLNFQWNVNEEADVALYDITGSLIRTFTIQGATLNTFNIEDLAPGPYIIRVTDRQTKQQSSQLFTKL